MNILILVVVAKSKSKSKLGRSNNYHILYLDETKKKSDNIYKRNIINERARNLYIV